MAKYDVLISYSRKDFEFAEKVCAVFDAYKKFYKFEYFFDTEEIKSANEYLERIADAITESKALLFLASKNSYSSPFCSKELLFANQYNVTIHRYCLDNSQPPPKINLLLIDQHFLETSACSIEKMVRQVLSNALKKDILPLSVLCGSDNDTPPLQPRNPINWKKLIKSGAVGALVVALMALFAYAMSAPAKSNSFTSAPYKVGDYYNDGTKEGVVFEVSADGCSGKIVSMTQSTNKLLWSSDKTEQERLIGANNWTNGAYNMAKVKAISGWRKKYPAFKWCSDLGEGWYLPAIYELKKFIHDDDVHDAVNRTLASKGGVKLFNSEVEEWCWSSTESDTQYEGRFFAWSVFMCDGSCNYNDSKCLSHYVRAVSAFGSVPTTASTSLSNTYKVGDYYNDGTKEGVVFEVSADGKHGKIVSMTQSTNELLWSSDKAEQKRLIGADSEADGAYNMAKVKAVSNWLSKYPSFKWCAELGEGWYLPAIDELKKLIFDDVVHDAVNYTLVSKGGVRLYDRGEPEWYWSSTEDNYQCEGRFFAWYVGMDLGDGDTPHDFKANANYVRAVSAF